MLLVVGISAGALWSALSNVRAENSVNSVLSWSYVVTNVPFILLGEELLCISILYACWKKLGWEFWQATLYCSVLFALWDLPTYNYNLLQCLVTIIPSRLVLNFLFKKKRLNLGSIYCASYLLYYFISSCTYCPIIYCQNDQRKSRKSKTYSFAFLIVL